MRTRSLRTSLFGRLAVALSALYGLAAHAAGPFPPVIGGCPVLPAPVGFSWPYAGGLFPMPDGTQLANVDFFAAPAGVCLLSVGATTYWFALPAAAVQAGYSGVANIQPDNPPNFWVRSTWDELVILDAAGNLHDVNAVVINYFGNVATGMQSYATAGPITVGPFIQGLAPGRGTQVKNVCWIDNLGLRALWGGSVVGALACPAGGPNVSVPLSAIPGPPAPVLAISVPPASPILAAIPAFVATAFAAQTTQVQNVGVLVTDATSVTGGTVPALDGSGFVVLVALVAFTALLLLRRSRSFR